MKRLFKYIENIWIGADGKVSLKRVLAIICFIVSMVISCYAAGVYLNLLKAVISGQITEASQVITAAVNGIMQLTVLVGALLTFTAGLLSLTGYLNLKQQQLNPPTAQTQSDTTEANTSKQPLID